MRRRAKIRAAVRLRNGESAGWWIYPLWWNDYAKAPSRSHPAGRWELIGDMWEATWPRALAVAEAYVRTGDPYPSPQLFELWERRLDRRSQV